MNLVWPKCQGGTSYINTTFFWETQSLPDCLTVWGSEPSHSFLDSCLCHKVRITPESACLRGSNVYLSCSSVPQLHKEQQESGAYWTAGLQQPPTAQTPVSTCSFVLLKWTCTPIGHIDMVTLSTYSGHKITGAFCLFFPSVIFQTQALRCSLIWLQSLRGSSVACKFSSNTLRFGQR